MPTLDANSLLSDAAPIWFDEPATADGLLAARPDPLPAALATLAAQARRPAPAAVPPPPADPLAQALPWLVRHLGVAAAVEAVVGPVDDDQPAASDEVLPALRRIGFDAHLQRRSLSSFSQADLPTVLMLHSGDACVLTARWQDAQGQAQCNLVLPGPQPDEFSTAEAEIEAEYSGVALVVSRPARPPLASALARARAAPAGQAAAGRSAAGPAAAADAAPMAHAEALVALAAAVQGAQRAMNATRADPAPVRPAGAAAQPLPTPTPMPLPLPSPSPGSAAAPLAAQASTIGPDDDPAAVLRLRFMQPDRPVITPGQALSRMAQAAHALVQVSVAPWRRHAVATMRAMGQGARAAGCHLAQIARLARLAQIARLARLARALATGLIRLARQGLQGPGAMAADIASSRILPSWSLEPLAARPQPGARIAHRRAAPWPGLGRVAQRLAGAAARLRLAGLGGLAAASALCLLVGAPQAWAAMLSSTSLQALQATPQLLRGAFSANFEQAGQALAAQGQARRVAARNRMGCELGQPLLAPAGSLGLPAEPARPAVGLKASRERQAPGAAAAAGQGRLAGLAPASTEGVRGRGLPRRARHACR